MAYFKDFGPPNWKRPSAEYTEQDFEVHQMEALDDGLSVAEYVQFEIENWENGGDGPTEYEVIDGVHVIRFYQETEEGKILSSVLKVYEGDMPEGE